MSGQPTKATLALVWARAQERCENCGVVVSMHRWPGYSIHHRRLKGMGGDKRPGTQMAANLLLLCGSGTTGCHGRAHGEIAWAMDRGLIVSRWAEPEEVGFFSAAAGWVLIDNEGGQEPWPLADRA